MHDDDADAVQRCGFAFDPPALAHHEDWARVVATLARCLADLDIAEEMAGEAFVIAVERSDGLSGAAHPCSDPVEPRLIAVVRLSSIFFTVGAMSSDPAAGMY
jgi:hypothetical protein